MMTTIDIDNLTLAGAVTALRSKELSAVELLQNVHQRYLQSESYLHSWVERFEDDAVAQAMVADRRIAAGSKAPLLGIPIGIKDILDVAGKATCCNSALRADCAPAVRDSTPVHRMRKAGAVLLGKTVTQEFAAGVVSAPSRNPWDPSRVPGGSSGGSAASVIAGTSLGALGSDTGGSVRIPASVNGSVGLKPTYGRIPLEGAFPLSASLDTVGPLTRTIADAVAMHLALCDRQGEVLDMIDRFARLADQPSLDGVRIGVMRGFFTERLQPAVADAYDASVSELEALGAETVDIEWEHARAARASALLISRVESAVVHHESLRGTPDLIGDDVRYRFEAGALMTGEAYLRSREARLAVRDSIRDLFNEHGLEAVIAPTTPATAPLADNTDVRFPDGVVEGIGTALTRLTMPWNATGQPVISIPNGFDGDGLPIGLSFIGRPDDDLRLAEISQHVEQATEWHLRRPRVSGSAGGDQPR